MSDNTQPVYRLRIIDAHQHSRDIHLDQLISLRAEAGARYQILDAETGQPVEDIELIRKGDTAVIASDGDYLLYLTEFYQHPQSSHVLIPQTTPGGSDAPLTPPAQGERLIQTDQTPDQSSSLPPSDPQLTPWLLGALGTAGLLAIAVSDDKSTTPEASPSSGSPTITGTFLAGPVLSSHDLTVTLYANDSDTPLARSEIDHNGSFSITLPDPPEGMIIARVNSSNPENPDYLDESSGRSLNLGLELSAAGALPADQSTLKLNINPLTTLAVQQLTDENHFSPDALQTIQQQLAQQFSLPSLQDIAPDNTINSTFDATDGLTHSEQYGALLAAISGMAHLNGSLSATLSHLQQIRDDPQQLGTFISNGSQHYLNHLDLTGHAGFEPAQLGLETLQTQTDTVIFDLNQGVSSKHSQRQFQAETSYDIYLIVNSDQSALVTAQRTELGADWQLWRGADQLGQDDRIILVGHDGALLGPEDTAVTRLQPHSSHISWLSSHSAAARLNASGVLQRLAATSQQTDLWTGHWLNSNLTLEQAYLTALPTGLLTSQGLA